MFNNAVSRVLGGKPLPEALGYFGLLHETQWFCNRVSKTMWSLVEEQEGETISIPDSVIHLFEDELDRLQASLLVQPRSGASPDLERFTLLAARLELQSYYFNPPASMPRNIFRRNVNRAYATAQALLTAALAMEDDPDGWSMIHVPHHLLRTVIDAGCLVFDTVMSGFAEGDEDPEAVVRQMFAAMGLCVMQDGDLSSVVIWTLESAWSLRKVLPPLREPIGTAPHRVGATVTLGCVRRWRRELEKAKEADQRCRGGGVGPTPGAPTAAAAPATTEEPTTGESASAFLEPNTLMAVEVG